MAEKFPPVTIAMMTFIVSSRFFFALERRKGEGAPSVEETRGCPHPKEGESRRIRGCPSETEGGVEKT